MEWITKKVVAALVNKWFGEFIEEIDSQEINDALLSGQLDLTNLVVRKDALSFLNGIYNTCLPVEVEKGVIGRLSLTVPYNNIFSQPLVINIQDVLLLVSPVLNYDPEKHKERERNFKTYLLRQLFQDKVPQDSYDCQYGMLGLLYNRIWNNMQLKINDVHIRYEDNYSCPSPLAMGFCLQSLSVENTNHKWKKVPVESSSQAINKVIEIVSMSFYVNPNAEKQRLVRQHVTTDRWKEFLQQGLSSHSINQEQFQFILSPFRCKIKVRQHVMKEARVPGLLVDAMMRECVNLAFDRHQYEAILQLGISFTNINLNRKFMKHRPEVPLKRHSREWWHYAYNAIVHEYIRPFSWTSIKNYRKIYCAYVSMYKRNLVEKRDSELEADLSKIEDKLNIETIVVGRMEAKIKLSKDEPDLIKPVVTTSCGWFTWLLGGSFKDPSPSTKSVDVVAARRSNQVFTVMTADEKNILAKELSAIHNAGSTDKHKEDIDQKIYLSLKEVTVSLKDIGGKDVGIFIVTGFVLSFENRFGINYQKVSLKMESLSMEASNLEDDLVHILKLMEGTSAVGYGVALALDFETNPISGSEDYGITFKLDPLEISYHQEALLKLIQFFNVPQLQYTSHQIKILFEQCFYAGKKAVTSTVYRQTLMALDIDIKSPYLILPEYGSIQKGGNVLILDLGNLKIFTELGGSIANLDGVTRMELEEKMYDHLTLIISNFQILFSDSGDEWRVMRTREDSELHLIPSFSCKMNMANNVFVELKEHPKQKLDIHITSLKINLSDNRINHLNEFYQHFPIIKNIEMENNAQISPDPYLCLFSMNLAELSSTIHNLSIKLLPLGFNSENCRDPSLTSDIIKQMNQYKSIDTISQTSLELAKYFPEESDEEEESLNKPMDLLGFEDNTSSSNMIKILTRFCVEDVTLCISRIDHDNKDRPFLMVKASKLLVEVAFMSYGPAIQLTVGSICLVDKFHHSATGEYLELINSSDKNNVLTILYRKVRADCPEFKSKFRSCEQSFVLDTSFINIVLHQNSVVSIYDFINELPKNFSKIFSIRSFLKQHISSWREAYLISANDPPVPNGATKWSTNATVSKLCLKFCTTDMELLQSRIDGFHCGFLYKANEKKVFSASLVDFFIEDLSESSLYPRLVEVEEDRVFDLKVVQNSPIVYTLNEENESQISCKPDSMISIQFGKMQMVFQYKLAAEVNKFFLSFPFKPHYLQIGDVIAHIFDISKEEIRKRKISLSISINTPTILIPKKPDSPSSLVLNFGGLKIDNFFKPASGSTINQGIIENILIQLGPFQICRAVMILGGGVELQEAIIEPTTLRIDLKRSLMRKCRDVLSWDVAANVESLYINLGQRDLNILSGIFSQYKSDVKEMEDIENSSPSTPVPYDIPSIVTEDSVGKLQAFLTHSVDIYRTSFISLFFESIRITLYTDMNEVLSSPLRDAGTALCKFDIGEIEVRADVNNDDSMELRATFKSCDVFDVRSDSNNFIKKIFGQLPADDPLYLNRGFKFNLPPLLDVSVKVSPNGDTNSEISLDKTRFNFSVGFALALFNYVDNAIPGCDDESIINRNTTYNGDHIPIHETEVLTAQNTGQSSNDSTSGYLSTVTCGSDSQRVVSISFKAKLPEVVLFIDAEEHESRILVLRFHFQFDYSKHPGNKSFKTNIDKAVLFSSTYSENDQVPYTIISPFYFESICCFQGLEDGEKLAINISKIDVSLCSPIIHIFNIIGEEIQESISQMPTIKLEFPIAENEDLWTPKPIVTNMLPTEHDFNFNQSNRKTYSKKCNQEFKVNAAGIQIVFEKYSFRPIPVFAITSSLDAKINNWSHETHGEASINLSIMYFNEEFSSWEYLLDPIATLTGRRLVEVNAKFLKNVATPIGTKKEQNTRSDDSFDTWSHSDRFSHKEELPKVAESSSDEENINNEMVILKPQSSSVRSRSGKRNIADIPTVTGFSMDSDSDTEGSLLYKITSTFSQMFSSESEGSADENDEDTLNSSDEVRSDLDPEDLANLNQNAKLTPVPHEPQIVSDRIAIETSSSHLETTLLVSTKDAMEFSITPRLIESSVELWNEYFHSKEIYHQIKVGSRNIKVLNEIGPNSKVSFLAQEELNGKSETKVLYESKFKEPSSIPSSPYSGGSNSRNESFNEDECPEENPIEWDSLPITWKKDPSSYPSVPQADTQNHFHIVDAVELYQDIAKHRIRIEMQGFEVLEVFVGIRNQNRLFQLTSIIPSECKYFVMVIVELSLDKITVTVRSPLQILNDLYIPIDICFKKSALHNIEVAERCSSPSLSMLSMGSASNPFDEYPSIVTLQPDEVYSIPLLIAYHSPIFLAPSAIDYKVCETGFWWKEMQSSMGARILSSRPKSGEGYPFSITCSQHPGAKIMNKCESTMTSVPNYLLSLSSPIRIFNYLPFTLVLHHKALPQPLTLDPGGTTNIVRMDPHQDEQLDVMICSYRGCDWKSVLKIPIERNEAPKTLILEQMDCSQRKKIEVSLYTIREVTTSVYIYAPYWIVNKTGLPLQIRGSRSKYISDSNGSEEILIFRYKKNNPHKIKIRVLESEWSRSWSCDAVGTCGVVICEDKLRCKKFRILSRVSQSTLKADLPLDSRKGFPKSMFHLTKIITLMPYFFVKNTTSRPLMYMQESDKNGLWFDIGSNQCESFWPNSDDMYLVVRKRESQAISQRFHINSLHKTALRIDKGKALVVNVEGVGSDHPIMITFSKYRSGDAPIRIENWCEDVFLRFHQKGSNQVSLLAPRQKILYTWDDPTLQRELMWNVYGRKLDDFSATINADKHGTEKVIVTSLKKSASRSQSSGLGAKVRPKRFSLRQRAKTAPDTSSSDEEEVADGGWLVVNKDKIVNKGLSPPSSVQNDMRGTKKNRITVHWVCHKNNNQRVLLFTQSEHLARQTRLPNESANMEFILSLHKIGVSLIDKSGSEIVYGALMPTIPMWQLEVEGIWKMPPNIELCSWLEDQYKHHSSPIVNLKGSMQVDLQRMRMLAPFSGKLRRIEHPAIWMHYRHSLHYSFCKCKLASFQIDNQKAEAVFPTVISSNRDKFYEKPSIEFCVMCHQSSLKENTIRHLSVINEDIKVNLDKGFMTSFYSYLTPWIENLPKTTIHAELKTLLTPLSYSSIHKGESEDWKKLIPVEKFCFAGIKLKMSYSPKGMTSSEKVQDVVEGLLISLGVSLTEINDVNINISQVEMEATSLQVNSVELKNHFHIQFLQQLYVLVLGIDILANPYMRLKDLSQCISELLYDSSIGTMQSPDDFAEEICEECYSLCDHIVGDDSHNFFLMGSAFDCDIRSLFKNKKANELSFSGSFGDLSNISAKNDLFPSRFRSPAGIAWCLSGMIVDYCTGSFQESMEGFLKDKGRSLVCLISNPCFEVHNPISITMDELFRAQVHGYEARFRLQPIRHCSSMFPLKPKCLHETEGENLLLSLPEKYLSPSDKYFGHVYLARTKLPPIFLATLNTFYYMEPQGNWGRCEVVWQFAVKNLTKQPEKSKDTITFQLRQDESQRHLSGAVRLIQCYNSDILDRVMSLVTSIMTLQIEYLPCPSIQ